ncbi:hypothetical protein RRG08_051090 [Elysia crispata]|uniref:BESS domain-containing protein n=1 Tax=Elysia crispata TaxID=231223 RepID=A0AAE1ADC5_9GAST|nr:hypothetical protein RRG08_051090 [Elysia crispata]
MTHTTEHVSIVMVLKLSRCLSGNEQIGKDDLLQRPNSLGKKLMESEARYPQERTSSDLSLEGDILEATKSMTLKYTPKDEDQLFLDSLAPKLRMLDPDSKLECQIKIQQLLQEYLRRATYNSQTSINREQESAVGTQQS